MNTTHTITIPADMVGRVRNSLFGELGGAAHDVGQASEQWGRESHPEWFADPLAAFDRARALMDHLGWTEPNPPAAAQIDVAVYGDLFLATLRGEIEIDDAALTDIREGRYDDMDKVAEIPDRALRMREYLAGVERELGQGS